MLVFKNNNNTRENGEDLTEFFRSLFKDLKHYIYNSGTEKRLIVIVAISLFLPFFYLGKSLVAVSINSFLIVGVAVLSLIIYIFFKKGVLKSLFTIKYSYAFLVFCVVTLLTSIFYRNYPGIGGALFLAILMIFSLFMRKEMTPKLFDFVTDIFCVLSPISFIVGVVEKFAKNGKYTNIHFALGILNPDNRSSSTFFNPNYYSFIIEIILLICVYKIASGKGPKLFYFIIAGINIGGLFLCLTRSAWIPIFIGTILIMLFLKKYKYFWIFLGITALILAVVCIFPHIIPRDYSLGKNANTRVEIWETAIKGLKLHILFGQGLWSYILIVKQIGGKMQLNAHNIILDPLINFGIINIIPLLIYLSGQLGEIIKKVKENYNRPQAALALAVTISMIIHCMTDLVIIGVQTSFMFMIIISVAGYTKVKKNRKKLIKK